MIKQRFQMWICRDQWQHLGQLAASLKVSVATLVRVAIDNLISLPPADVESCVSNARPESLGILNQSKGEKK